MPEVPDYSCNFGGYEIMRACMGFVERGPVYMIPEAGFRSVI